MGVPVATATNTNLRNKNNEKNNAIDGYSTPLIDDLITTKYTKVTTAASQKRSCFDLVTRSCFIMAVGCLLVASIPVEYNVVGNNNKIKKLLRRNKYNKNIFVHLSDFMFKNRVVVIEEYKLAFFTINKNGSTSWLILLRKMMGFSNVPNSVSALHHKSETGLTYLKNYEEDPAAVAHIFTSPEWTRAVFLRDPIDRWLSAYLNKGVMTASMAHLCCTPDLMGKYQFESFRQCEQFLMESPSNGFEIMKDCEDPHWEKQSMFIRPEIEPFINFVGRFENMEADAEALLRKIGAWEQFGASGYGPNGTDHIFKKEETESPTQDGADGSVKGQQHATHAHEKLAQMISPDLKAKLLDFYKVDYENPFFNFSVPEF